MMTTKEEALLRYLEFNLIGLVDNLEQHMAEGTDPEVVYGYANDLLVEMRESLTQPTGLTTEQPPKL